MRAVSDFDRITPNIAIWHGYDSAVKAGLYSTCLITPSGSYFIDPIPLRSEALGKLVGADRVAGIIVTNCNHHRESAEFAKQSSVPVFAHAETFSHKPPCVFRKVADGDEICSGLRVIGIQGAAEGEIVLHYAPDGGTLIVGDALINFGSYGFTFLPRNYCTNEKQMRRSLQKVLDYQAERIFFAHGTPILSGASDRLKSLLVADV
jgi:glyoxylase-like metal-dependent hydrolase (beta-lactamase superfamily II)